MIVNHPAIVDYVEQKVGAKFSPPYTSLGFAGADGELQSAFVFNNYTGSNIDISIAAEKGRISRQAIKEVARYTFGQLGCRRISVLTRRKNRHVLKMAPRFGFRWEAVLKSYFPDDDAVLFRMTRDECRWL